MEFQLILLALHEFDVETVKIQDLIDFVNEGPYITETTSKSYILEQWNNFFTTRR